MTKTAHVDNFKDFFKKYPIITFEKGERVIRPGELETNVVLIKSGIVRIHTIAKKGKEVAITCLNSDHYNGIVLGLAPFMNRYYLQALTTTEIWKVSKKEFIHYAERHPQAYQDLTKSLMILIKDLFYQVEWLKTGSASEKIATLIYNLATRIGVDVNGIQVISIKTTHQEIAQLAGLTRETVTTHINKLKKKGIVSYEDNTIQVKNLNLLKAQFSIDG